MFKVLIKTTFKAGDVNDARISKKCSSRQYSIFPASQIMSLLNGVPGKSTMPNIKGNSDEDERSIRFIVDLYGVIWLALEGRPGKKIPAHSEMAELVLSAGNIFFAKDGLTITGFSNKSGGFEPDYESLAHLLPLFCGGLLPEEIIVSDPLVIQSSVRGPNSKHRNYNKNEMIADYNSLFSEDVGILSLNHKAKARHINASAENGSLGSGLNPKITEFSLGVGEEIDDKKSHDLFNTGATKPIQSLLKDNGKRCRQPQQETSSEGVDSSKEDDFFSKRSKKAAVISFFNEKRTGQMPSSVLKKTEKDSNDENIMPIPWAHSYN